MEVCAKSLESLHMTEPAINSFPIITWNKIYFSPLSQHSLTVRYILLLRELADFFLSFFGRIYEEKKPRAYSVRPSSHFFYVVVSSVQRSFS
jgi:hypothetical protein